MSLYDAKLNTDCIIVDIDIDDDKMKIRLMELGLTAGTRLKVTHKSIGKKTLLVVFHSSCFTLKDNIAKAVKVNYA